ncbi:MAG: aspartate/tyrosine/aromatic aminotransferase [Novosphingobium sp.]|nr:aspartate/tyrosine/aromatic aminotransferase [Novosphingobium sp.]
MFENLVAQPADALLNLIKLHNADPRVDKIDLGVGVYRTGQGDTPVFAAIKQAEAKLLATQNSKAYLGPEGDMGFVHALMPYIFGAAGSNGAVDMARIEGMQAPGGTGGVRLAIDLARRAGIKRVWMGTPSWPNHAQIIAASGLELKTFGHMTKAGTADLDALLEALREADSATDAVLLHGCCHNPTGVDYTPAQWDEIAALFGQTGVLPILDLAYQGLGHGMEADAYGVRKVCAAVPEALIAYSCDKNFGMYRDRVGAFYVMTRDGADLDNALSNGAAIARASWSMPPDHGAAAVRLILEDAGMTAMWLDELDTMRARMRQVRERLAAAGTIKGGKGGPIDMVAVGAQSGLFSMLPLTSEQIMTLRSKHGIYMAGSGRINIAGLTVGNIEAFIAALADVAG